MKETFREHHTRNKKRCNSSQEVNLLSSVKNWSALTVPPRCSALLSLFLPLPRLSSFYSTICRLDQPGNKKKGRRERGKSNEVSSTYLQRLNDGWRGRSGLSLSPLHPASLGSASVTSRYTGLFFSSDNLDNLCFPLSSISAPACKVSQSFHCSLLLSLIFLLS